MAKQKSEHAKKSMELQLPKLDADKQRLLQGLSIQKQFMQEQETFRSLQAQSKTLEKKLDTARTNVEKEQNDRDKMKQEIEVKESDLQSLEVASHYRSLVQQALQEKKEIDILTNYLDEKRVEWKHMRDHRQKCVNDLEQLHQKQALADKKSVTLFQKNLSIYNQALNTSQFIRSAQAFVDVQREKIEKAREETFRHNLSLKLVKELVEGQPCPVCGALHHPNPAINETEPISEDKLNNKKNAYLNATDFLNRQQQEIRICIGQLEQHARLLQSPKFERMSKLKMIHDAELSVDFDEWEKTGLAQVLDQIERRVREEKQDQLQIVDQLNEDMEHVRHMESAQSSLKAEAALYAEKMSNLEEQATAKKNERDERMRNWSSAFPAFGQVEEESRKINKFDQQADQIRQKIQEMKKLITQSERQLAEDQLSLHTLEGKWSEGQGRLKVSETTMEQLNKQLQVFELKVEMPMAQMISDREQSINQLKKDYELSENAAQTALENYHSADKNYTNAGDRLTRSEKMHQSASTKWEERLDDSQFGNREDVLGCHLHAHERIKFKEQLTDYEEQKMRLLTEVHALSEKLGDRSISEVQLREARNQYTTLSDQVQALIERFGAAMKERETLERNHELFRELELARKRNQKASDQFDKLQRVFRGNAFVEFVAEEQLQQVCIAASKRLGELTHDRYVLEVDEQGGFIIRDDGNGGVRRPVSSLSGGETFLTSLALALSLSEQIQLRGNVPLQFFFLDEGFGSLDPDLLDTVVTALEKLHMRRLAIGVISHVPEMRERLPRRLIVTPALPSGHGSRVQMEML
ncbi:SbcC/MukB-like Walker B domain-containing protein [Sporolactobacillus kofuensis]|uniref:Nuclease SbcCD subunit C n=2 Tax=Sporolactobacillus kofuensis TaxID=269672 RepID=A0ABW1WKM2_9BACL